MAYDEGLAERIREQMPALVDVREKKMFGGLVFMVDGHMCVGIIKDDLMARVGPLQYDAALKLSGAREMDFTGKAMRGFIHVDSTAISEDDDLAGWIDRCLEFVRALPPK